MNTEQSERRRLSVAEFYRLLEQGCFQDRRVDLIDGEVVEMAAQKNWHLAAITLTQAALQLAFGPGYWVRVQGTLDLSLLSAPDPDLAVVAGNPKGCSQRNPTTALLLVEVSDTTLAHDRGDKASLYAAAGIADYWIVNLVDWQLEVYRQAAPDPRQPFSFGYSQRTTLVPSDSVVALAAAQAPIAVLDLFP